MYIVRTVNGNICEIAAFRNQANNMRRPFFNSKVLIIVRDILYTVEGFSNSNIGEKPIADSVSRMRMMEIKASIRADANNQNALSKLRNSIISKII